MKSIEQWAFDAVWAERQEKLNREAAAHAEYLKEKEWEHQMHLRGLSECSCGAWIDLHAGEEDWCPRCGLGW